MIFLTICFLCIMATSKVTVQGKFSKQNVKTLSDGIFFNGLIFVFSALIFCRNAFTKNVGVIAFAAVFGILTVLFQLTYIKAMSLGNISLTVMIVNLSMVIPIIFSVVFYGEKLTALRIAGICLTIAALVISVDRTDKSRKFKLWLFLSIAASVCNGGLAICQKMFGKTAFSYDSRAFVAWSYIVAGVVSFCLYLGFAVCKKGISFTVKPSVFGYALAAGAILGIFQAVNTKAVAAIDSAVLFPSYNGGVMILSALSGVILLGDKLKRNQTVSVIIGIAAIVLMNL